MCTVGAMNARLYEFVCRTYVVQKVSSVRADGQSEFTDDDERKEELEKWNRACAKLLSCLRDAMQRAIAAGLLPPEALYKHQKSGK